MAVSTVKFYVCVLCLLPVTHASLNIAAISATATYYFVYSCCFCCCRCRFLLSNCKYYYIYNFFLFCMMFPAVCFHGQFIHCFILFKTCHSLLCFNLISGCCQLLEPFENVSYFTYKQKKIDLVLFWVWMIFCHSRNARCML